MQQMPLILRKPKRPKNTQNAQMRQTNNTTTRTKNIKAEVTQMSDEKTKPTTKYKAGSLQLSVWKNKGVNDAEYNTYTFQRNYKKDDKWENTTTLRGQDLPVLKMLLEKAFEQEKNLTKTEQEK